MKALNIILAESVPLLVIGLGVSVLRLLIIAAVFS